MPDTQFHCGDLVKVTDFSRYATFVKEDLADKEFTIVGIHPVTIHGEVDFADPEIQYYVPNPKPGCLGYYALVGTDLTRVGHVNYRSVFGRFRYYDLLTMLRAPQNSVEDYVFQQCLQKLLQVVGNKRISANSSILIENKVKDSQDYFTRVGKGNCLKISLL